MVVLKDSEWEFINNGRWKKIFKKSINILNCFGKNIIYAGKLVWDKFQNV